MTHSTVPVNWDLLGSLPGLVKVSRGSLGPEAVRVWERDIWGSG